VVWGGGGVEIQNIPLSYEGGVVDWVVSSVEGSFLRIGQVCLWLNLYNLLLTITSIGDTFLRNIA
jgi:hypothetical protein